MDDSIFVRIEHSYDSLSRVYREIADYIRSNYNEMHFLSISELSDRVGVSTGSITGFCRALNYTGYLDFQKEMRRVTQNEMIPIRRLQNSIATGLTDEDILLSVIHQNIDSLKNTYSGYLKGSFEQAVEFIRQGRKVYVLGLRSAYAVAYYLYFMLGDFMDNIVLLTPGTADMYDRVMNVDSRDVLVSIGFEKYTRATCEATEYFRSRSSRIIALTDNQSSPLAVLADVTLLSRNNSTTFDYITAMTICNALVIAVGRKTKKKTLATMDRKEQLLRDRRIYI